MFNDRERATVLAALRFWQCQGPVTTSRFGSPIPAEAWWAIHDISTDSGSFAPLKDNEIDRVCERLNAARELKATVLGHLRRQTIKTIGRWARWLDVRKIWNSFQVFTRRCRPLPVGVPRDSDAEAQVDETCFDCQLPGFFCSGVPGIVAHVENGRLSPEAKVERCDACLRYPTDEATLAKLRELGF